MVEPNEVHSRHFFLFLAIGTLSLHRTARGITDVREVRRRGTCNAYITAVTSLQSPFSRNLRQGRLRLRMSATVLPLLSPPRPSFPARFSDSDCPPQAGSSATAWPGNEPNLSSGATAEIAVWRLKTDGEQHVDKLGALQEHSVCVKRNA